MLNQERKIIMGQKTKDRRVSTTGEDATRTNKVGTSAEGVCLVDVCWCLPCIYPEKYYSTVFGAIFLFCSF
jgi:hypothetical protein